MSIRPPFSQQLQAEMDKRHWSQSDLARAAHLNRAVINKVLNGLCQPRIDTLGAIARAFDIPPETTYRAAGLLPQNTEYDESIEEAIYLFRKIKDNHRRTIAVQILRILTNEVANVRQE
jgi:transcriptional regulator with XRE-family HTH domain